MLRMWFCPAFLSCMVSLALPMAGAQPATDLSGGVLIVHTPGAVILSGIDPPPEGWCAYGSIDGCDQQCNDEFQFETGWATGLWYVIAAFSEESQCFGVEFGITYSGVSVDGFAYCVPSNGLEIQGPGWPESGAGTSVIATDVPWTGSFLPVYYFWASYYYAPGGTFTLGDNPGTPDETAFMNCYQETFPAACYGSLGFGEFQGIDCCPAPAATVPEPEANSSERGEPSNWSEIKALYR